MSSVLPLVKYTQQTRFISLDSQGIYNALFTRYLPAVSTLQVPAVNTLYYKVFTCWSRLLSQAHQGVVRVIVARELLSVTLNG
jgi:hypothetical protein